MEVEQFMGYICWIKLYNAEYFNDEYNIILYSSL